MIVAARPDLNPAQQKVLHICCSFERGGTEKVFLRFLKAQFKSKNYAPVAVVFENSWLSEVLHKAQIPHHAIEFKKRLFWPHVEKNMAQIEEILAYEKPALVQSWATRLHRHVLPEFPMPHIARMDLHSHPEEAGDAQVLIAPTENIVKQLLEAGVQKRFLHKIPTPVNIPPPGFKEFRYDVRAAYSIPAEAFLVLMLGRLQEAKGFDVALYALNVLPERVHMLIVGEGDEHAALKEAAIADGLTNRAHFAGWIDNTTPFFAAADAFLLPSRRTASVNVVLEAWAHRLPVVATSVGGASEVIEDGQTGLLVPPEDDGKLALSLQSLLDNPELAQNLARAGEIEVREKLSTDKVLYLYEDLYRKILG